MTKLFQSMDAAQSELQQQFGVDESFDVVIQKIYVKQLPTLIVYISGLVQNETIAIILTNLQHINSPLTSTNDPYYFNSHFNHHEIGRAHV